ncbi:MAG: hypothetical protein GY798_08350 [Hyphomicrobiales bacterium]|nr:hypothetical protein [Hyphomicrobiales bacterium]
MKRVLIGNLQGDFVFRSSRPGVDANTLVDGEDAILHEDQRPVAALYSGEWVSSGDDNTTIALPDIDVLPFNVLMNPGDGAAMLPWQYYAWWDIAARELTLVNNQGAKTFTWAVLVDL